MLKPTPSRIFCGILSGALLLLIAAWASGSTGTICEYNQGSHQNDCATYSLAIYVLIKGGDFLNFYGALIAALATIAIAAFTYTLKISTDNLWRAGETQIELTRELFVLENRPWVAIDIRSIRASSDLTYNVNGANIQIAFNIKNVGQTPAIAIMPTLTAFNHADEAHLRESTPSLVVRNDNLMPGNLGFVLFPTQENILTVGTTIPREEIDRAIAADRVIFPIARGGVTYQFAGATRRHHTLFEIRIQRTSGPRPDIRPNTLPEAIFPTDGNIPVSQLTVIVQFGGIAD